MQNFQISEQLLMLASENAERACQSKQHTYPSESKTN